MITTILEIVGHWIISVISTLGYSGIVICMSIESACIPLPSEVIMPFSGYLVFQGQFNLWLTGVAGALGCVVGSAAAYVVGIYGGRPFIERYGKYVLISHHDLNVADRWFDKYGDWVIFFSRLLPVIRTYISLPAGIAKMHFPKFLLYTFIGSFPWCLALAFVGLKLGEHWMTIRTLFHRADLVIGIGIVILIGLWLYRHLKK
ncbi:MAG: DedA family protein [Candidatus Edwardsbacteria bacterium]